jgi:hypothetical protein
MSWRVERLARGLGDAASRRRRAADPGQLGLPVYAPHEIPSDPATKPVVKPGSLPIIGA